MTTTPNEPISDPNMPNVMPPAGPANPGEAPPFDPADVPEAPPEEIQPETD